MRKSLKDISWQVDEPTYREDSAISYSTLARFNREGFNNLDRLFDKVESPSLLFGSLVDTLLTDGEDAFNDKYVVADFPKIGDKELQVCKALFEDFNETYRSIELIPDSDILDKANIVEFQNNWKPETRIKVLRERCSEYYALLYMAIDKVLVSTEDYQDAVACTERLKSDPMTEWYFQSDNPFEEIETLYQLKFKGEYNGISMRCMMDVCKVDHENKIIYPIDLKTSFHYENEFPKSFIDWGYWIQAQYYAEILRQNCQKDEYFKDFTIMPYRFIVIKRTTKLPLVWEYKDTFRKGPLSYGSNGQFTCRDWRDLLTELNYYLTEHPQYPINIHELNDISRWLNQL